MFGNDLTLKGEVFNVPDIIRKGIDFIGICVVFYDNNSNVLMGKRNKNYRDEHGCWDIGEG